MVSLGHPRGIDTSSHLVEQVEGLSRADAMTYVVGPALSRFLRPIYKPTISSERAAQLPSPETFEFAPLFFREALDMVQERLDAQIDDNPDAYAEIDTLVKER